jgi:hypothetical protein
MSNIIDCHLWLSPRLELVRYLLTRELKLRRRPNSHLHSYCYFDKFFNSFFHYCVLTFTFTREVPMYQNPFYTVYVYLALKGSLELHHPFVMSAQIRRQTSKLDRIKRINYLLVGWKHNRQRHFVALKSNQKC